MIEVTSVLVVGVGHRFRGDDLVGPFVCDLLSGMISERGQPAWGRLDVIDADVMPENYQKPIRNSDADIVLFVDAVNLGEEGGALRRIRDSSIEVPMPNTHSLPLTFIMSALEKHKERVELIGVQAVDTGLFNEMTGSVRRGGEELARIIYSGEWENIPALED